MMGQSDTESTCSSIRVNPGSPRDPSVFLDEAEGPMPLTFGRETAGSPSSSSGDSGDFDSSVIITGEVPKRNTRGDIPIIDLTSPDHEEHSVDDIASPPQAAITETLSDVREIAERIEQRLQGLRRRVASIRQIRRRPPANSPLARVRRSCPYGRRERVRNRDRTENHITVSSPAPVFTEDGEPSMSGAQVLLNDVNPIPIPEEDTPIVIDIEDNEPDGTPLDSELEPYSLNPLLPFDTGVFQRLQQARERTQNSLERARRLTQEARRTIEIVERRRPNCLHPDEVIAQRLQDHYDRESGLAARQQARSAQEAGSFTSRASTANVAAPSMSSPLQYRRRRLFRPHHFAGPDTVPDLLLPFVSVVSLPTPPPLHHFEPSADNEDYEALWNLSERLGPVKSRGLSKEAIERIPSYRYSSKDSKNGNCVICMMEYSYREKLRRLKCEHNYHSKCIDRWLKNNRTCPVCRSEVNP